MGIGIGSGLAIYFIIWWMLFFVVLTIGNRDPEPEDARVAGADQGAPARPAMRKKVAITTVLAFVAFGVFLAVINSGLTLEDVPLPAAPGT
ncbi:MAG: DUF1467 family protein [Pseudomonadota bacterium]